ncbi:MAG: transcription termination/antitermination NusG family protein [Myxococcota bacterium]|nr:transcription termination/antitermination NusG family protein [Myxococcota bacterium]
MSNTNLQWYVVGAKPGSEKRARRALIEAIFREGVEEFFELVDEDVEVKVNGKKEIQSQALPMVLVPVEEFKEFQNKKTRKRTKFPGYIFVHCELNTQVAYVIRSATDVKNIMPKPLEKEEVDRLLGRKINQPAAVVVQKFQVGDSVRICEGAFRSKEGRVEQVDVSRQKYRVGVSMFGRLTTIELDFTSVEPTEDNA